MTRRGRQSGFALLLASAAAGVAALAVAADDPAAPPPAGPGVVVAEHVSAARGVVPFTIATDGSARTVWATGRTRAPSVRDGLTVTSPAADAPAQTLLLEGAIAADDRATAWRRAGAQLDRDGQPLPAGGWRVDDGTDRPDTAATSGGAALHAGAGTPAGAAALLVRIAQVGGAPPRAAVLARTSDGRFRELPAPPGDAPFAAPAGAATPMAVADAPLDGDGERGRTAVLLAPAGGDGVLRWDGATWRQEPWEDTDGTPLGARTALALGATADGDAVALLGGDPAGPDPRASLLRRDPDAEAFRPVSIEDAPLLDGPMPAGVTEIRPVPAPGQPLTVAGGHWWIDLLVTRDDGAVVSTTVHLRPGDAAANATAAWCEPQLPAAAGCDRELGFRFATGRGYRSQAFPAAGAGEPFGQRLLTSPVIPEATGDQAAREASASGGFLQLRGETFALRSGAGDDGAAGTQAGAFAAGGFAVVGGARTVGRTMPDRRAAFGAFDDSLPLFSETVVDVALSPPGTPADQRGAIDVTPNGFATRQQGTDPWTPAELRATVSGTPQPGGNGQITAVAWDTPSTVILVGRGGALLEMPIPEISTGAPPAEELPDVRFRPEAQGKDLLDVAARPGEAWAVGRNGAALRRAGGTWSVVALPTELQDAHLTGVAFAGTQALVASTRGVLVSTPGGGLAVDEGLAALMQEDGRPVAASAVAGLPDGAAIVDARYVRTEAGGPWQRLASPAEGDVVAVAAWRDPAGGARLAGPGDGTTTLRIAASLADTAPPVFGPPRTLDFMDPSGSGGSFQSEGTTVPRDGRLALLGPDGWIDAVGAPVTRSVGRDLGRWAPPITSFALDAAGNGWAVGGLSSIFDALGGETTTAPASIRVPLGSVPVDTRPVDARTPPTPPAAPAPLRILVGGHPACLDECAGRGDQGVAPDATVREALRIARGLADPAGAPPVLVVGGGRASTDGAPLSLAGARRYAELLRSEPGVTIAAAIGSADARTPESRAAFRRGLADLLPGGGAVTPVTTPTPPVASSDTIAYAFDVPHDGRPRAARVVVIDNAGGALRGGADGPQARWLSAMLAGARTAAIPAIVVGAARLDMAPAGSPAEWTAQLRLLTAGGARAYVATDGVDDVNDRAFGANTGLTILQDDEQQLLHYRTAALGHAAPFFTLLREDPSETAREPGYGESALLSLTVSGSELDGTVVPVFAGIYDGVTVAEAGQASYLGLSAFSAASSGFVWTDPGTPGAAPAEARTLPTAELSGATCSVFAGDESCGLGLRVDASYRVADPDLAVFVRARARRDAPPEILTDRAGNPTPDPTSPVLCPLRPGRTTIIVRVSGRTATFPLRVAPARAGRQTGERVASCTFGSPPGRPIAPPAAPAVPAPVLAPAPAPPAPGLPTPAPGSPSAPPAPSPPAPPAATDVPSAPLVVFPATVAPLLLADGAAPPVAAAPKPPPAPPPATPGGLSAAPALSPQAAPQAQLAPARQRAQEAELAREGTTLAATRYEASPAGAEVAVWVGGAGALVTFGMAGAVVGWRRRAAQAAARRWLA